jgi:AcrR family transcriptional regulator
MSPAAAAPVEQPEQGRVARKRSQKVREILMASAQVLNRDGYHAMSMDDVAERLDLTKATLYHYFGGKDELVAACLTLVGNEVNDRLEAIATETADGSAPERLHRLLTEQLTILLIDYPEAARLFAQPLDWPDDHLRLIRTLRERHDAVFRSAVTAGIKAGQFRDVDQSVVLHCIYGAINYAPVWIRTGSRAAKERTIESVCRHLLKMLN